MRLSASSILSKRGAKTNDRIGKAIY